MHMAKIELKTAANAKSVSGYVKSLPKPDQAAAQTLTQLFERVTKTKGKMWGSSIIGFGEYDYSRSNGDTGVFLATGFSMRKSGPTLYIMPGYSDYSELLEKLGPHKLGKSCLYLKNLEDIDLKVIEKLIKQGLKDLKKTHTVRI